MRAAYCVRAVRAAERAHAEELASGALMARAAWAVAMSAIDLLRDAGVALPGAHVVLLVGGGNNGGDALFAGAVLARRGLRVRAVGVAEVMHEEARRALLASGGRVLPWREDTRGARELLLTADLVIDGITGISGRPGLQGDAAQAVTALAETSAPVLAVDVPSGVDADTGAAEGVHVRGTLTVTFGCAKPGLLVGAGRAASGRVIIADIGIDDALTQTGAPQCRVLDGPDARALLRKPRLDDHKYRRGVVGVAAGSPAYPGAAVLTVEAAARIGVGMVTCWDRVASQHVLTARPDAVLARDRPVDQARVSAWACGPGMTNADVEAVGAVLESGVPVVLDAGALACLTVDADLRRLLQVRSAPTVLTPHDGEAARLTEALGWCPSGQPLVDARRLATELACVVLWKGPGTVIADAEGVFVDDHGGPELACAGSGDVLTGIIAGLLAVAPAQADARTARRDARDRAAAGAWLHAEAGRRALARGGPVTALDLLEAMRGLDRPDDAGTLTA